MGLTVKERQQRFRDKIKGDPDRLEAFRAKERKRYHDYKEIGMVKPINEMSERSKRSKRRRWRLSKKKERQRKKDLENDLTPPASPAHIEMEIPQPPTCSRQKIQSKKKRNRYQAKCYRDKAILEKKLENTKRTAELYRLRIHRMKTERRNADSPRSKTKKLLRNFSNYDAKHCKVRKALNFHHALLKQLSEKYKLNSAKRHLSEAIVGRVIKKYKLVSEARRTIGVQGGKVRRQKKGSKSVNMKKAVKEYFERDDNSRMSTGIRQTVTKNKEKRQKRFMLDTLQHLYRKFKAERYETCKSISFTTFWRLKPFWVKCPTEKERETCLCKTCENLSYMAKELYRNDVISTKDISVLVEQVACSTDSMNCMFGNCKMCKEKQIDLKEFDQNKLVTWTQWVTEKEKREIKGDIKDVTITKRKEEEITAGDLLDKVHDELWLKYRRHSFMIDNQMNHYKNVKGTLKPSECFLHIDFAENYIAKLAREIKSKHFGASQVQISLHTGYFVTGTMTSLKSFCGVSDSLQHDPISVWAYLKPILMQIRSEYPEVDTLHFYSDGPSSQYKQKMNFYLFSTEVFDHGFKQASWNFHAAGHGKGIPDGIGASVKRSADLKVKHGVDIVNATDLCKQIWEANSSVNVYLIKEKDILDIESKVRSSNLKTIPGTMKIHQLFTEKTGSVRYRSVSCECYEKVCDGHDLQSFTFSSICTEKTFVNRTKQIETSENETKPKDEPKKTRIENDTVDEDRTEGRRREGKYRRFLKLLQACETFDELQLKCVEIHEQIEEVSGSARNNEHYSTDILSVALLPTDYKTKGDVPVTVRADGDCLPASGSMFVFGNDKHPSEIRTRIIIEQVMNAEFYLNEDNLLKGYDRSNFKTGTLIKGYTMYSEEYMHGNHITETVIKEIYSKEVLKITKERTYMGIRQIHSLSSVIGMMIDSIYPEKGNPSVRKHLCRHIYPREVRSSMPAQIMWTTTRLDMNNNNWVPNHFVPVLPNKSSDPITFENVRIKNAYKELLISRSQKQQNKDSSRIEDNTVTIDACIGRHVLVLYYGQAYPGLVENVDMESQMVFVECMHTVGEKNNNCFSWPRKMRDRNWYDIDDILRTIPPPEAVKGNDSHLKVNDSDWREVMVSLGIKDFV